MALFQTILKGCEFWKEEGESSWFQQLHRVTYYENTYGETDTISSEFGAIVPDKNFVKFLENNPEMKELAVEAILTENLILHKLYSVMHYISDCTSFQELRSLYIPNDVFHAGYFNRQSVVDIFTFVNNCKLKTSSDFLILINWLEKIFQ